MLLTAYRVKVSELEVLFGSFLKHRKFNLNRLYYPKPFLDMFFMQLFLLFFRFKQHEQSTIKEFETFNAAVDEFFSQLESQKLDLKVAQQEKQALKKLDNIRKDHETRLQQLEDEQAIDRKCGELIEMNAVLVEKALTTLRTAIANQIDWKDIKEIIEEAGDSGDPVLSRIRKLKLEINHFTMLLSDPYEDAYLRSV